MTSEIKGRFAIYHNKEKQTRMSLSSIKVNWGSAVATSILRDKELIFNNSRFELELLPGEKNASDIKKETICRALFLDLRQTYPTLTYAKVVEEADKLIAGEKVDGIIGMWITPYLEEMGLIRKEGK